MNRFSLRFCRLPLCAIALVALCAGCAAPPAPVANDNAPGVRMALEQAFERADQQKEQTVSAQQSANLSGARMNVIWEGEAAEILSRIATAQKMKFKITGPQPRLQLPVFVRMKNVTLTEALNGICEQFGQRADVLIDDSTIELRMKLY